MVQSRQGESVLASGSVSEAQKAYSAGRHASRNVWGRAWVDCEASVAVLRPFSDGPLGVPVVLTGVLGCRRNLVMLG
jgi:hypothetical protein